jgi:cell division protein ZapA (FtsZ GTPase activity inhibitor)
MDEYIKQIADQSRYMNEVKLNVMFATMVYYDLPWLKDAPITDLVDITSKYRAAGIIK